MKESDDTMYRRYLDIRMHVIVMLVEIMEAKKRNDPKDPKRK